MTKDCKEVFTEIYRSKVWGDGSGGGSAPDVARPYIDFVSKYLMEVRLCKLAWETPRVLDIGCGDGVVASHIDFGEFVYRTELDAGRSGGRCVRACG